VTATLGSSTATTAARFVADSGSASLTNSGAGLSTLTDDAVANGTATDSVKAVVTDAHGNPVAGVSVGFSADNGATIAATGTTGADGSVTVTLTSTTAGTSTVTATLGSSTATTAARFVAGSPDDGLSTLTALPGTIRADGSASSSITWQAKDVNGNPVTGLSNTGFSTGSATGVTVSTVTEGPAGTYNATLTGTTAQTVTLSPTIGGIVTGSLTATIILTEPPQTMPGSVSVNGATFNLSGGFPTTGFTGATFQVLLNGSATNNSSYTWSSNQTWVSVDNSGHVSFIGTPTSATKTVTITATPTASGTPYTYTFTVSKWFVNNGGIALNWNDANTYCSSRGGLGTALDLTNVTSGTGSRAGNSGALWSEWGALSSYSGSGFISDYNWTSEFDSAGSGNNKMVRSDTGSIVYGAPTVPRSVVCRQGL
ncbi:Ig-like domain-containing protein, partial [Kosakonia oryziphila]